jgi:hypothetical protein
MTSLEEETLMIIKSLLFIRKGEIMNKKQALTMSALAALFLVACGEASSLPSSQPTSTTPTSSATPTSTPPSSITIDPNEKWGIINGDFEDESDDFAFQSAGWNAFIGDPTVDGIVATATYKTEGTNQYGALSTTSIGEQTQWWHAQLRQNGVYVYAGASYVLSFKVRAAAARTIRVTLKDGGLTERPINEVPIAIGTTWETKTINFSPTSDGVNAELQFGIGPDSFLPADLVGFARSFAEVHLDDVKIEIGEALPNQAPSISGGDLLVKLGDLLLVRSGLVVRDDYDKNLSITDVTSLDITQGTKLNPTNPVPGIYTFLYTVKDSEGLVGTHQRQIIVTDPNQLINNTQFNQFNASGMPVGWSKFSEDNRGGQSISAGVRPHLLPESLLGNLGNGNFEQAEDFTDSFNWATFLGTPAADGITAAFTRVEEANNSYMKFETTSVTDDTNFWHAQLQARNVRIPKGNFTLEFRARAAAARTIRVALAGGGIVAQGRAIDEVPVLLTNTWATYRLDFTATAHAYGSQLQFFFGPDSFLPEPLISHARKTDTVFLDDVTFRYEDVQSPVATMIPTMAIDLWRIGDDGMPWENQIKYNIPFFAGNYKLNFKASADAARPVMLVAEGDGGVGQPRFGAVPQLTTTVQSFTYDISFEKDATNASYFLAFFMGSYTNYGDFKDWWPNIANTTLSSANNVLTTVYLFDFTLTKVN